MGDDVTIGLRTVRAANLNARVLNARELDTPARTAIITA